MWPLSLLLFYLYYKQVAIDIPTQNNEIKGLCEFIKGSPYLFQSLLNCYCIPIEKTGRLFSDRGIRDVRTTLRNIKCNMLEKMKLKNTNNEIQGYII